MKNVQKSVYTITPECNRIFPLALRYKKIIKYHSVLCDGLCTVFSDWTGVVCDEDDVVCKIARNMSKPVDWQDPPPGQFLICRFLIECEELTFT